MTTIIVAAIAAFIFSAIWFTFLFGKTWARLMKFTPDEESQKMGMAKPMVLNFLTTLLSAIVVYSLFPQLLSISFGGFLKAILIIWLGFSFPIYANAAIWERKSWQLVLINSVQGILFFTLISAVVYYWR